MVDVALPPREVSVRVETVDRRGRRAGRRSARLRPAAGSPPASASPHLDARLQAEVRRLAGLPGDGRRLRGEPVVRRGRGLERARHVPGRLDAQARDRGRGRSAAGAAHPGGGPTDVSTAGCSIRLRQRGGEPLGRARRLHERRRPARQRPDAFPRAGPPRDVRRLPARPALEPPREPAAPASRCRVVEQPCVGGRQVHDRRSTLAQLLRYGLPRRARAVARLGRTAWALLSGEARYLLFLLAHVARRQARPFRGGRPEVQVPHKAGWVDPPATTPSSSPGGGESLVAAVMTYRRAGAGTSSDVLAGRIAETALRRFSG